MSICEHCLDALATTVWCAEPRVRGSAAVHLCASCRDEAEARDDERRSLKGYSDEELERF